MPSDPPFTVTLLEIFKKKLGFPEDTSMPTDIQRWNVGTTIHLRAVGPDHAAIGSGDSENTAALELLSNWSRACNLDTPTSKKLQRQLKGALKIPEDKPAPKPS